MQLLFISKGLMGALPEKSQDESLYHALHVQAALALGVQILGERCSSWTGSGSTTPWSHTSDRWPWWPCAPWCHTLEAAAARRSCCVQTVCRSRGRLCDPRTCWTAISKSRNSKVPVHVDHSQSSLVDSFSYCFCILTILSSTHCESNSTLETRVLSVFCESLLGNDPTCPLPVHIRIELRRTRPRLPVIW